MVPAPRYGQAQPGPSMGRVRDNVEYTGPLTGTCENLKARAAYRYLAKMRWNHPGSIEIPPRAFVTKFIESWCEFGEQPLAKILNLPVIAMEDLWFIPKSFTKSKSYRDGAGSFHRQVGRCSNPQDARYKNNGAKGVRVLYKRYPFIKWWVESLKTFKGTIPTTGRKDHDGNYEFANIEMQDKSENSRERSRRAPSIMPMRKVFVHSPKTRKLVFWAESTCEMARCLGYIQGNVSYWAKREKTKDAFLFSYKEVLDDQGGP